MTVSDLERARDFYTTILALTLPPDQPLPNDRFDENRIGLDHLSFAVSSRDDLERAIQLLDAQGGVENDWIGKALAIGDAPQLQLVLYDPRCLTTLTQDECPKNIDVTRILTRYNWVQAGGTGLFLCAGVYAASEAPGMIRIGDRVAVA